MPRESPYRIELTPEEKLRLEAMAGKYSAPYCSVIRAKVILLAAQGVANKEIAGRLDLPRQVVSRWRKRFWQERLDGLADRPRKGRPAVFPPLGACASEGAGLCTAPRKRSATFSHELSRPGERSRHQRDHVQHL